MNQTTDWIYIILTCVLCFFIGFAVGLQEANGGTVFTPTFPGTGVKDLSQPQIVERDGTLYQTFPGTGVIDLDAPSYVIEDGEAHETFSGTGIIDLDGDSYIYD